MTKGEYFVFFEQTSNHSIKPNNERIKKHELKYYKGYYWIFETICENY